MQWSRGAHRVERLDEPSAGDLSVFPCSFCPLAFSGAGAELLDYITIVLTGLVLGKNKRQPVDKVEDEEKYGEGYEEELVDPEKHH